jgi:hypothetical protein
MPGQSSLVATDGLRGIQHAAGGHYRRPPGAIIFRKVGLKHGWAFN